MVRLTGTKSGMIQRFQSRPHPGVQPGSDQIPHLQRKILFHGHEPLDTDTTPDFASETWILKNDYTLQAEVSPISTRCPRKAGDRHRLRQTARWNWRIARYIAIAPKTWKHGVTIKGSSPGAPLRQAHPFKRDANGVMADTRSPVAGAYGALKPSSSARNADDDEEKLT